MYSFLFDRKSLILLVAGLATVGCLLFFAGLLTGVFWRVPSQEEALSPTPPNQATAALFPASQPCPPAAEPETAGEGPDEPTVEAEPEFEEPVPMLEAKRQVPPSREPAPPELRSALPSSPEPAPSAEEGQPVSPSEEAAPTLAVAATPAVLVPSSGAEPAGGKAAAYSLQVGAFRQPENSARIVRDLKSRGYDAYVVEEKGSRAIQTVRIGRFSAREEALRAALDFRRREGKEAIVRTVALSAVRLTSW